MNIVLKFPGKDVWVYWYKMTNQLTVTLNDNSTATFRTLHECENFIQMNWDRVRKY